MEGPWYCGSVQSVLESWPVYIPSLSFVPDYEMLWRILCPTSCRWSFCGSSDRSAAVPSCAVDFLLEALEMPGKPLSAR